MLHKMKTILKRQKTFQNENKKSEQKNIYGIYKKMNEGQKLVDIHDLIAFKINGRRSRKNVI